METRKSPCCPSCFESIAKNNTKAAKLWINLCEAVSDSGIDGDDAFLEFYIKNPNCEEWFRTLEVLRFIVSTETNSSLVVKLQGYNAGLYCVNGEKHD